ncbi:MAG TPA: hypothetical protein VNT99_17950 [Methylomirabilota bacterium]|nr:hypothetical protein [Methylomirabilota bacterium]
MHTSLSEEVVWANGLAARLRVLQANGSDTAATVQQEFIAEELERALKEVVPSKRKVFLQTLADRFPAWHVAALPGDAVTARAEIVEDTPERRLESLVQIASELTEKQKADFTHKLKAAGFVVVERTGTFQVTEELQKVFGKELSNLDADRALKLLILTASFALSAEKLVWKLWKEIGERSNIRRDASPATDMTLLMRRYLGGDSEVSSQQINQLVEQSRKLTAGLLMALGGVGPEFAKKFQEKFVPNEIEALAQIEKKFAESIEKACWRKYGELYNDFGNDVAIDNLIKEAVVRYVIKIMGQKAAA